MGAVTVLLLPEARNESKVADPEVAARWLRTQECGLQSSNQALSSVTRQRRPLVYLDEFVKYTFASMLGMTPLF